MDKFLAGLIIVAVMILVVILISLIVALPVLWLWNWLMPSIFGLPVISWLQAWGLCFLAGLLVKGTTSVASKK